MSEDRIPPLEGELLTRLTKAVRRVVGFNLSEEDVKDLYDDADDIRAELRDTGGLFDTTIDEMVADVFASEMVGRTWPIGEEGEEVRADFLKDLTAAAKECGWIPMGSLA